MLWKVINWVLNGNSFGPSTNDCIRKQRTRLIKSDSSHFFSSHGIMSMHDFFNVISLFSRDSSNTRNKLEVCLEEGDILSDP